MQHTRCKATDCQCSQHLVTLCCPSASALHAWAHLCGVQCVTEVQQSQGALSLHELYHTLWASAQTPKQ